MKEDKEYKNEMQEIENAETNCKRSIIFIFIFVTIALIIQIKTNRQVDNSNTIYAILFYSLASICLLCAIYYKIKESKLLSLLAHKRLDELVEKFEELRNKN